jgi:predicted transcriptional regulator
VVAPAAMDRAFDGTPLYAPRGELRVDVDEQRVQCHLCGRWYRALAPTHLARAHGVTADEYRVLVGLLPRHSLWAPDMIQAHRARLISRLAAEPRLRAAMAKGLALAQRGELQREARARFAERTVSVERQCQLAEAGGRLGSARAAAFQRRRELRAVELGFADLAAYYERRYRDERRRLDQLAAELGCAQSAVRGDLRRLGLGPDRTRSHGARWRPAA